MGVVSVGGCHMWAEQNGIDFAKWIIAKRGDDWWDNLQVKSRGLKIFKEFTVVKSYLESFLGESQTPWYSGRSIRS